MTNFKEGVLLRQKDKERKEDVPRSLTCVKIEEHNVNFLRTFPCSGLSRGMLLKVVYVVEDVEDSAT